jgi:aminopeptidase YwaD
MADRAVLLSFVALLTGASCAVAQSHTLLPETLFHAIRDESSGERPLVDFQNIVTRFSGFTPSRGGDGTADYIASRLRSYGLDTNVESFPSDGRQYYWAFLGEPSWEGESAVLTMVKPRVERLADFAADRGVLGRYSTSADVTAELVDVGEGTQASDYEGKNVRGKLVLVTGNRSGVAELAHREAVWRRGARGVVIFRTDMEAGTLIGTPTLGNRTAGPAVVPWRGPNGEPPGFVIGLSPAAGEALRDRLRQGETVVLHAQVKASTGPGAYRQVSATLPGSDPAAKEIWIKAHDNFRNTGGGNNLTGVGAVIEMARLLNTLIANGTLPRPRRTIRFLFSAEHYGEMLMFRNHPDLPGRILGFFSVDMVGFNQAKVRGVPRLALMPFSKPHFVSEVCEHFFRAVGDANTNTSRIPLNSALADPTYAPTGSRDEMHYTVEPFWGPSDHEDLVESSIGVPAVEYGHPFNIQSTAEDTVAAVDATQMRREVLAIAATTYFLASAEEADFPRLASLAVANSQARMGSEARRANDFLENPREAWNLIRQSHAREIAMLRSLLEIAATPKSWAIIERDTKLLDTVYAAEEAALQQTIGSAPELTEAERRLAAWIVVRNPAIRGPVTLFRPEYGAIWLAEKSGDPDFAAKLKIAGLGRFTAYEALNFVNGKRSLLEIADSLKAEYGPVPPDAIEQYFKFLERVGVVTIDPAPQKR